MGLFPPPPSVAASSTTSINWQKEYEDRIAESSSANGKVNGAESGGKDNGYSAESGGAIDNSNDSTWSDIVKSATTAESTYIFIVVAILLLIALVIVVQCVGTSSRDVD